MLVRRAKFADIIKLWALMQEAHQRSRYADKTELDERLFKSTCVECLRGHSEKVNTSCAFVSEDEDGLITGFILGITDNVYHFGKNRYASDLVTYVKSGHEGAGVELYREFLDWAENAPGVINIRLGATDVIGDYRKTEILFKRHGFIQEGVLYRKEIGA